MSIAGGMPRAVERARSVDADALQVFVKSSNQWKARPLIAGEALAFREAASSAGLAPSTVAHASYLINLASPSDALWRRSIAALKVEVGRCLELGITMLVVHPGAHMGSGEAEGLERIVAAVDAVLGDGALLGQRGGRGAPRFALLLETTAGQGTTLGHRFEQIGAIIRRSSHRHRLGVCFDTCHALAAGYEFRDARSYRETFAELDAVIGLDRLRVFHLNDSRAPLGGRVDRHAPIGRGEVGLEAFRLLLNDRRFRDRPMILETPKSEDLHEDRENLAVLRSLARP